MKVSSNNQMDKQLNILQNITRVEAPAHLYHAIMEKVKEQDLVSWHWVRGLAAAFLCLVAVECYVLFSGTLVEETVQTEELMAMTDNFLYHE